MLQIHQALTLTSHLTLLLAHIVEIIRMFRLLACWTLLLQILHDLLVALFDDLLRCILLVHWVGVINQSLYWLVMHLNLVELLGSSTICRVFLHLSQSLDLI